MSINLNQLQHEFEAFKHFIRHNNDNRGNAQTISTPCLVCSGEYGSSCELEYQYNTGKYFLKIGIIVVEIF